MRKAMKMTSMWSMNRLAKNIKIMLKKGLPIGNPYVIIENGLF